MARKKDPANPFYVLLVIVGVVFLITACAYGVMAFRADRLARSGQVDRSNNGLVVFMRESGGKLLAGELLVLGLATAAAMVSDRYWARREEQADVNHGGSHRHAGDG